jgi:superfamily II DNA or RNA helicase
MLPVPRPYQTAGVDALRGHILAERKRVILCCPTGGGKTIIACHIIHSARRNFFANILFVAHRLELIDQTVKQLAKWGVTEVGVIRADDERTNSMMPVQVATIQSLSRRNKPAADIIFVDEAHRCVAFTYRRLLELYPDAVIIGLTATPCRLDGKALGDVFQAIEIAATYKDLIKDGFIVEPRCFGTPVEPKLDGVRTQHGDFVIDELADAMMEIDVLGDTVAEYKKHAHGRRTVVFAVNVAHSKALLEKFLAAGVRAAHVDSETPEEERIDISRKLDTGELEVVTNVAIFTEGWDQPCVKCLIIARPTKSLVVFMQQAGRGLRPWNENTPLTRSWQPEDGPSVQPIIIDQGGNLDRHGFPHEDRRWSLEGRAERENERKPTKCIKCLAYIKHYPCEACGFAPPAPPPREIVQDTNAELEERVFTDPRKAFFDRKLEEARMKGFKPAFASAKFKEEYGDWPPWSWGQAAKESCANDEMWKRRIANKEADRARYKKQEEEVRMPQYDTDEDFADWARRET